MVLLITIVLFILIASLQEYTTIYPFYCGWTFELFPYFVHYIPLHVFCRKNICVSIGYILRNRIGELQDMHILSFSRYCQNFPKQLLSIPAVVWESSSCFTDLICGFRYSHSGKYVVLSHWVLISVSLMINEVEYLFTWWFGGEGITLIH